MALSPYSNLPGLVEPDLAPAVFQLGKFLDRLRSLRQRRVITQHQYGVAETLVMRLRARGSEEARGSFSQIARLAGVGRTTVVAAVRRLLDVGVLQRFKHTVRVYWGYNRSEVAVRQDRNSYCFVVPITEVAPRPVGTRESKRESNSGSPLPLSLPDRLWITASQAGADLLAARRLAIEARLRAGSR